MTAALQVDGIDVHVEGEGPETVVMIHGWPDTWRLWDAQVDAFAPRYRCVRFTLPGFDIARPRRAYSLAELVEFIGRVVDRVSPDGPVILMVHDWGSLFGYQYAMAHPQRVSRLIGLDIGDAGSPAHRRSLGAKARAMIFAYQIWLAIAWRIGGAIGDRMSRSMARWLRAPGDPATIDSRMNYPYDIAWTGSHGSYRSARPLAPEMPMLFVFGSRKPFMFHSAEWADQLAARPGSRVVALETGHWLMCRRPERFNEAVLQWLAEPVAPAAGRSKLGDTAA